jgi:hypothetical protein
VVLGVVLLTATASARTATLRLYSLAAAEACMRGLPDVVVGLPPVTPPAKPVVFVYHSPPGHMLPTTQLDAWSGNDRTGDYGHVSLSFFKSVRGARMFFRSNGGNLIRNVVVRWERPKPATGGWREAVEGCVRATPPAKGVPAPKPATPRASLATFTGLLGRPHSRTFDQPTRPRG